MNKLSTINPFAEEVINQIVEERGVSREVLLSDLRTAYIAHTRQETMLRLHEVQTPWGTPMFSSVEIGRMLNRDHSTVLYGFKRARKHRAARAFRKS